MSEERAEFDALVDTYDAELRRGMALSGENPDFYARERVLFLAGCLEQLGVRPGAVLDYGCGLGATAQPLNRILRPDLLVGVDESSESLKRAVRDYGAFGQFLEAKALPGEARFDLVYCSGVLHHIPPPRREEALAYVKGHLRPGGVLALWENNPWNPIMSFTMKRAPIDRNAVKVSPLEARRLLLRSGFEVLQTHFLFYFPRALAPLRVLEPRLRKLPLGAQYQVLCRKP